MRREENPHNMRPTQTTLCMLL